MSQGDIETATIFTRAMRKIQGKFSGIEDRVIRVTSIAAMEAYSAPVGYVFSLNAGGRSGVFDVVAGDFSTELAADTLNGIYVGLADDTTATTKVAKRRFTDEVDIRWYGAVKNTDSTEAIQAAFDSGFNVFIPKGDYIASKRAGETYCLHLKKNVNLRGAGPRLSRLVGADNQLDADILLIDFTEPLQGFGDIRDWKMGGLYVGNYNGDSRHGCNIGGSLPIINALVQNCAFSGKNGYSLYFSEGATPSHSMFSNISCSTVFGGFGDANVFEKFIMFGESTGFVLDLIEGVRNNVIRDSTIVNRNGAIHVINGSNVRIENNQMEQNSSYSPPTNQNAVSAMVWIEGRDRKSYNTVIRDNNFGGGTNLNNCLYIDSASRTVVDANNFVAVNTAEIYLTENSDSNVILPNQRVKSQVSNPRTRNLFREEVVDLGQGNMGTRQPAIEAETGWSGGAHYKSAAGVVTFLNDVHGDSTTEGTYIGKMSKNFIPLPATTMVRTNLLEESTNLPSAGWSKNNLSVSISTELLNETLDTFTVEANSNSGQHNIRQSVFLEEAQYTVSGYFKREGAGTASDIALEITDLSNYIRVYCNVDASSISSNLNNTAFTLDASGVVTADLSLGWGRYYLTFTVKPGYSGNYNLGVTPNNVGSIYSSYTGDPSVHKVLAVGLQINTGSIKELQQVEGDEFFLPLSYKLSPVYTLAGPGDVRIYQSGKINVGSLPSAESIYIYPFQSSVYTD
jgi:hypothetical protein